MTEKLLLTVSEAAEMLGLGRTKVYQLVTDGALDSVAIGRARRIPAIAVEQFVRRLQSDRSETD